MCIVDDVSIAVWGVGFVEIWSMSGELIFTEPSDDKRRITNMCYYNKTIYGCEGTGKLLMLKLN
jgi:hypothetical protein